MTRWSAWLRLLGGLAVLAFLLQRFGAGPFAEVCRAATWQAVLTAFLLTAFATVTSAWRWRAVARALGVPLGVRESVAAYYRSQFLNAVLPGGVLGDADRAVRHGRAAGDLGAGVRATVWDRVTGQVVQVALALLALVVLPTPWRGTGVGAVAALALLGVLGAAAVVLRRRTDVWLARDLRVLVRPAVLVRVVVASCGSTAGHLAVFAVAAGAVWVDAPPAVLVTTGLVVLVGSSIPLSVAGWGPREGVTAWAFDVVGLGAATGLTVAVLYGVLAAVATLPGAVVLLADVAARWRLHVVVPEPQPQPASQPLPEPVEVGRG
jgi:glycosyltransferase 2 family protein